MLGKFARIFRPLDTSEFDAAMSDATAQHRAVQVRARALRMDVSCGDPEEVLRRIGSAIVTNLCLSPQGTQARGKTWDSLPGWTRTKSGS